MNNEYPIFMQKIAPKSDFLYVQCTMYDVRLMYDMVLGTIYNRMTLDKIKYQMSIVNYQLSKYVATIIMRSSMCLEWGLLALARRTYSSYLPPATIRCGLFRFMYIGLPLSFLNLMLRIYKLCISICPIRWLNMDGAPWMGNSSFDWARQKQVLSQSN